MKNVSVCMATYNGAPFIREQINSILPQLGIDDEIIFSDDGSSDETLSIISAYQDRRFKIINDQKSGSPAKNFERGLKHCTGEFIFLADQDDVWMSGKINRVKNLLNQFDLVLTDCSIINEHGQIVINSFFEKQKSKKGLISNLVQNSYMGCCMAFHRKILVRVLPFPPDLRAHDQWIGLIAEKHFTVHFLKESLVQYRRHRHNYSFTGSKSPFSLFEKVNHRLSMINNLYSR